VSRTSRGASARRILFHSENFAPGTVAEELALWLAGRGHEVEAVAAGGTRAGERQGWWRVEEHRGIRVTRCPRRRAHLPRGLGRELQDLSFALSSAPVLLGRARRWRPHLIAGVDPAGTALPAILLAARRAGAASWIHLGGTALLGTPLLRRADHVSMASFDAAARLAAAGIAEPRRLALPIWADTRFFHPLPESPLRDSLALAPDAVVALYVGSLESPHAVERVVEAARLLPSKGAVVFVLAGRGSLWPSLAAASHLLPLKLLPWPRAASLNALLGLADLHLVPAGFDRPDALFPAKPAALLASGRPILAAGAVPPGLDQAVQPMPGDAEGLAGAIVRLAANPGEQRRRGEAARRAAQDYHDKERVFRALERALGLRDAPQADAKAS
jgi:putative colanic acid biosynthesis glycosyltransferase WcaI